MNPRRILCVFPRYARSFATMHHAWPLVGGVRAFMPPQGLLTVAAYLPAHWEVRFVDENVRPARDRDYAWADAVLVSGMHVQREQIGAINRRAHAFGRLTVLGGPSVSACPEWYPEVDILYCGELGDAADRLVARLETDLGRPQGQEIYRTSRRLPLEDFPLPAYRLIDLDRYFVASAQFSSGCPYACEFCDIPELYGRTPRQKTPAQVTAELDAMLARGNPGGVYFVDDNFIADRKAAVELLEELVRWQERRGYPVEFTCESTLNLARHPQVLTLMREANFRTVFCGIETPEEDALRFIGKSQNLREPILDSVRTMNGYGLEVISGIILGLDTDTPRTADRIIDFIDESGIPVLTINLLQALPGTPLRRRLQAAGRLREETGGRDSNVEFLLPYETVSDMWLRCISHAYRPEAIYRRFEHQCEHTYPNRKAIPLTKARANAKNLLRGLRVMGRIAWHVGILSDYRRRFWRMARPYLRQGRIEEVIHTAVIAHHMIRFARDCAGGAAEKSFYRPW